MDRMNYWAAIAGAAALGATLAAGETHASGIAVNLPGASVSASSSASAGASGAGASGGRPEVLPLRNGESPGQRLQYPEPRTAATGIRESLPGLTVHDRLFDQQLKRLSLREKDLKPARQPE